MSWKFWKKKSVTGPSKPKVEKLPGPKGMSQLLVTYLMTEKKQNPEWLWTLKTVVRPRSESKDAFDFRVFNEAQVAAKEVKVKDYTSLDEHPDLILYQGWFNKRTGQAQVEEKKAA